MSNPWTHRHTLAHPPLLRERGRERKRQRTERGLLASHHRRSGQLSLLTVGSHDLLMNGERQGMGSGRRLKELRISSWKCWGLGDHTAGRTGTDDTRYGRTLCPILYRAYWNFPLHGQKVLPSLLWERAFRIVLFNNEKDQGTFLNFDPWGAGWGLSSVYHYPGCCLHVWHCGFVLFGNQLFTEGGRFFLDYMKLR